jgi:hypothetical protein
VPVRARCVAAACCFADGEQHASFRDSAAHTLLTMVCAARIVTRRPAERAPPQVGASALPTGCPCRRRVLFSQLKPAQVEYMDIHTSG